MRSTASARRTILFVALATLSTSAIAQDAITRMSVASDGTEGNGRSGFESYENRRPSISADGRFVAFESAATNLVSNDSNGVVDIFVHDRLTGATVRVSLDSAGNEANGDSGGTSLSQDGRFVAFTSLADNLVTVDTNSSRDVFVHDRDPDGNGSFDEGNGVTTLVSVNTNGVQGKNDSDTPAISADGNLIAFFSLSRNLVGGVNGSNVFLHDRAAATTICVSVDSSGNPGNNQSVLPSISADGRCVSFMSAASNLVPGDTGNHYDIFVHELASGITTRVSVDSSGVQGDGNCETSALSSDGSIVAFDSFADNLDSGDTNYGPDIFIHDRVSGSTERVSLDSNGVQGNGWSLSPTISADGRVVAFDSESNNLVANDTNALGDIFVHDRATGTTTAASFNCGGVPGDGSSIYSSISADGSIVVFLSFSDNLASGDTNGFADEFAHDLTISDPNASWNNYGAGFPGTHGIPSLTASANPVLGTQISIDIGNSLGLSTPGLLMIGASQASVPTNRGGTLLVAFDLLVPLSIDAGGSSLTGSVPSSPDLCGISAFLQTIEIDAGAAFGWSFTPGLELAFGH
jgi:hypothetical protein